MSSWSACIDEASAVKISPDKARANSLIETANEIFVFEKKLFNLKQVFSSGVIGYLRNELSNPTVILFGSYAKGEDVEESDIDLYLETPSKKTVAFPVARFT